MSVVNTNKRQKSKLVEFGICMPQQTIERIEAIKGPYLSRGKYILRAVDKLLAEEEEKQQVTIAPAVGAAASST